MTIARSTLFLEKMTHQIHQTVFASIVNLILFPCFIKRKKKNILSQNHNV